jgi:hypothetical protein
MLKVSAPYVRETPVIGEEGKPIVLIVSPPGLTIGFRLRFSKQTHYLNVKDAYMAAKYTANVQLKAERPKGLAKDVSVPHEILTILKEAKHLHIATLMMKLKEKGLAIDRRMTGAILELLKETGKVKQDGFEYSLK